MNQQTYLWNVVMHEGGSAKINTPIWESKKNTPIQGLSRLQNLLLGLLFMRMEYLTTLMQLQNQYLHLCPKSFFG